jgi:hypothetical protein
MHLGPAQKSEIIDRIYSCKGIPGAAEKCDVPLRHVMEDIDDDDDFRLAVERALTHLTAVGEQELMRRAIDGTESVVTSQGRIVEIMDPETGMKTPLIERKYSDTLLSQFMKSRSEGTYGDKLKLDVKHSGHIAVPVISQEDLMRALMTGSRLDFKPPEEAMEAEYSIIRAERDQVKTAPDEAVTNDDAADFDFGHDDPEDEWDIL